jgi:23S rRNA (guanosine2251-2'-O)-methyltransferase
MIDQRPNSIYGIHSVREAVRSRPGSIEKIYFEQDRRSEDQFELLKECRRLRIPYQVVPLPRLEMLCPKANHQGVIAVCPIKEYDDWNALLPKITAQSHPPIVLIPASVEDPGNLGSIIRSCAAFGVDAILLEQRNTAPLGATAAKSSAGALEKVAIARPRNLEGVVGDLKLRGFVIIGAEAGASKTPDAVSLVNSTVLILGGEDKGIPPYLRKQCDHLVGIPIEQDFNSLNVSVAAGILLYECQRQRSQLKT